MFPQNIQNQLRFQKMCSQRRVLRVPAKLTLMRTVVSTAVPRAIEKSGRSCFAPALRCWSAFAIANGHRYCRSSSKHSLVLSSLDSSGRHNEVFHREPFCKSYNATRGSILKQRIASSAVRLASSAIGLAKHLRTICAFSEASTTERYNRKTAASLPPTTLQPTLENNSPVPT